MEVKMIFLDNMKFRNKLIMILLFPVIGLLFFCVNVIVEKYQAAKRLDSVSRLSEMAITFNALLHELQKERGITTVYVGSGGKKASTKLSSQRSFTNERLNE